MMENLLEGADWQANGRAPALHTEAGAAEDQVVTFTELVAQIRQRANQWAVPLGEKPGVVAVCASRPWSQLTGVLAGWQRQQAAFPANAAWWPRERDAALERLGPAWTVGEGPQAVPIATTNRPDRPKPTDRTLVEALWLASAGSAGDPTPYAFSVDQVRQHWLVPDPAIAPGANVVVTGELGHAPTLRFVLGALSSGACVRLTTTRHLAALLADERIDHLCTTTTLLRRALRQLHQRGGVVAGVGHTIVHQGQWRPHERPLWPQQLRGEVEERVSSTEAGGWALLGTTSAPAIEVHISPDKPAPAAPDGAAPAPAGTVHIGGAAAAVRSTQGERPLIGWDSGDLAQRDGHNRLHWQNRRRDQFLVEGQLVDPVQVEAALAAHRLVAEIAIAPRPQEQGGNVVVAVVVAADPEWPPFLEDLVEAATALNPQTLPQALAIVDELPINAAGAIHRRLVNYEEASR